MWSNKTGEANIEGDQIEVFKILNGHENVDPNIFVFLKITTGKITRENRSDFRHYSFSRGR